MKSNFSCVCEFDNNSSREGLSSESAAETNRRLRACWSPHSSFLSINNQSYRKLPRRNSCCKRIIGVLSKPEFQGCSCHNTATSCGTSSGAVNVLRRRALSRHFSNSFASSLDISGSSQCSSNHPSSPVPNSVPSKASPFSNFLTSCFIDYSRSTSSGYASRRSSLSGSPCPSARRNCYTCWSDTSHIPASACQSTPRVSDRSSMGPVDCSNLANELSRSLNVFNPEEGSFRSLFGASGSVAKDEENDTYDPSQMNKTNQSIGELGAPPNLVGYLYAVRFPALKQQMENRLDAFIAAMEKDMECVHCNNVQTSVDASCTDQLSHYRLSSDATARFAYSQILELAKDCLRRCGRTRDEVFYCPHTLNSTAHSRLGDCISLCMSSCHLAECVKQDRIECPVVSNGIAHERTKSDPCVQNSLNSDAQAETTRLSSDYFNVLSDTLQKVMMDCQRNIGCSNTEPGLYSRVNEIERIPEHSCYDLIVNRVTEFLIITARSADVLECLESNPNEFYCALSSIENQLNVHAAGADPRDISHYLLAQLKTSISLNGQRTYAKLLNQYRVCEHSSQVEDDYSSLQNPLSDINGSPQINDFDVLKRISSGAYGSVYLVKHKQTSGYMALKRISKTSICRKNFIQQVFTERDILSFVQNPFVVSMYCSFETDKDLCMVMEYVEGGDVRSLLDYLNGPMSIDMATLYFAEATLAVEYIHSCGIIHRDIMQKLSFFQKLLLRLALLICNCEMETEKSHLPKPSNLLITACGHIKLTDFGLSRIGLMDITSSQFQDNQVMGTPQYIAPEVILRTAYGQLVDWWSMGILLYEMLVGCTPFLSHDVDDLFDLIVNGDIDFPEYLDHTDAKCLIEALLNRDTNARPYCIRDFPFFSSIDWEQLLLRKAEFIPALSGPDDTSYFTHCTTTKNPSTKVADLSSVENPNNCTGNVDAPYFHFSSYSPSFTSYSRRHHNHPTNGKQRAECSTDSSSLMSSVEELRISNTFCSSSSSPQLSCALTQSSNDSPLAQSNPKSGRSKRFRGSLNRARSFFIKHVLAGEKKVSSLLEICLNRDSKLGFGFTFASFKSSTQANAVKCFLHRILFVCPGGPADNAGIRKNHRILSIQDQDAAGLTHSSLVKIVQKCVHCIHIALSTVDRS